MDYSRKDLADRLAAAYVTGTLRGAARRRFATLLPAHPTLRAAEQAWQQRLMPLTLSLQPVAPSPAVWQGIQSRLFHGLKPMPSHRPAASAPAPKRPRTADGAAAGWWDGLALWRGLTALSGAAALVLAVLLAMPQPVMPPVIVVLNAADAPAGSVATASFVASISGDGAALVTRPLRPVSIEATRALELWAVPPEGAPRSLGLISAGGATVLQRGALLKNAAALAVSLEPVGGSRTGAPTGPILFVGKLTS